MTEAELKEFLDANKADIQQAVKAKMIDGLLTQHRWTISEEISKIVSEFVAVEIVPEVKKFLTEQKGPIIEAACVGAAEVGNQLSQALIAGVAKNLDPNGYKLRGVMKALFD
jgi:hypothetical protein